MLLALLGGEPDSFAVASSKPERFPVWKREPMKSRGVRFMGVKNYNVFYAINKKLRRVSVFRVLYNRCNV